MFTQTDELSALRESPFGRALGQDLIARLLAVGSVRDFPKGHIFFNQGEKVGHVVIMLQGRVSLTASRSDGEQAVVDIISEGEVFPLAAVVLGQPAPVGAEALTNGRAVWVEDGVLQQMLKDVPAFKTAIMSQLGRQYHDMVLQNKALKLQNTNQRLAHFLLMHTDMDDGAVEVRLLDERRMLARRLGMTPESLSRAIAQLVGCGVEFSQQRVLIRDVDRLRQFCGLERV